MRTSLGALGKNRLKLFATRLANDGVGANELIEADADVLGEVLGVSDQFEVVESVVGRIAVSMMKLETVRNRASMHLPKDAMEKATALFVAIISVLCLPPPAAAPRDAFAVFSWLDVSRTSRRWESETFSALTNSLVDSDHTGWFSVIVSARPAASISIRESDVPVTPAHLIGANPARVKT